MYCIHMRALERLCEQANLVLKLFLIIVLALTFMHKAHMRAVF